MFLMRSATEMIGFSMFVTCGTIGAGATESGCSSERLCTNDKAPGVPDSDELALPKLPSNKSPLLPPPPAGCSTMHRVRLAGESIFSIDRFISSESDVSSRELLRELFSIGRISSFSDEYFFFSIGFGVTGAWWSGFRIGLMSYASSSSTSSMS